MEIFYDVNLIVPIEGAFILNEAGGVVFNMGVPGLETVRPDIFGAAQVPTLPDDEEHGTDYQDSLIGNFGATAIAAFAKIGNFTGLGGTFLSGAFWFWIGIMGVGGLGIATGNPGIGLVCALPIFLVGLYLGLIPLVYILLPLFMGVLYALAKLTIWRA